jgi:hypothetical protein
MRNDHKKPLQVEDLYSCLPEDKSETIGLTLEKYNLQLPYCIVYVYDSKICINF